MPKMSHVMMLAGSGALAGATLTYLVARARALPAVAANLPARLRNWIVQKPDPVATRSNSLPNSLTGNHAFDEYRDMALGRLEDEAREFREFLDRLRHARDKSEFDQFMSERKAAISRD